MEKKKGVENSEWKDFRNEFLQRISSQERERNISITTAESRYASFDSRKNFETCFIFLFFYSSKRLDREKERKFRSNEKFFGTNF